MVSTRFDNSSVFQACIVILVSFSLDIDGIEITVSQRDGLDSGSCLTGNASQSCASLQYAIRGFNTGDSFRGTHLNIAIRDGVYILTEQLLITQPLEDRSITVTGAPNRSVLVSCANVDAGITIEAHNVNFLNLVFQDCGPRFAAVVRAWSSRNIAFINCTFQHNRQAGINAFDSSFVIENCLFLNNTSNANNSDMRYTPGQESAGGGAAFIFHTSYNLSVTIKNTQFISNAAVVDNSDYFVAPASNSSILSTGGGGMTIVFAGQTQLCEVVVDETKFYSNAATHGGGLHLLSCNLSRNNRVKLINSKLWKNWGSQAGGGLDMSQWDTSNKVEIYIKNCSFEENISRRGGGVNVFYMNFIKRAEDSHLQFNNVLFKRNIAYAGAAVRLGSALPLGDLITAQPNFVDCTFDGHVAVNVTYTAPLTSQRVSVTFRGRNIFVNNVGAGAAEFESSIVHVKDTLQFFNNSGTCGGALFLRSSQIKLYPDSELLFKENHASVVGGAMSVSSYMMYEVIHKYNTDCFLTYSQPQVPPSQWKVRLIAGFI